MPSPVFAVIMVVIALAAVMLIAWLSSRRSTIVRAIGALLSGVVSIYCLIYVVALIADSRAGFKAIRAVMVLIFAGTSVGAVYAAFRGFYPRIGPGPTSNT